jgi:hypothetical protein
MNGLYFLHNIFPESITGRVGWASVEIQLLWINWVVKSGLIHRDMVSYIHQVAKVAGRTNSESTVFQSRMSHIINAFDTLYEYR